MIDERPTINDINRWTRTLLVVACLLLFVNSVLSGVNMWQGTQRNKRIDHIDKVVTEAKDAAKEATQAVNAAVATGNTPEAKAQVKKFFDAIDQIEQMKLLVEETNRLIKQSR